MSLPSTEVGYQLPSLDLPQDRTLTVGGAMASQDFEDVHHNPGKAQERGTPDIFMSINSTNGFIDRYVTDWTGSAARIRKTFLRLGVPNFPGDTMTFTGEITAAEDDAVTVQVTGSNSRGVHVAAAVTVEPTEGASK